MYVAIKKPKTKTVWFLDLPPYPANGTNKSCLYDDR